MEEFLLSKSDVCAFYAKNSLKRDIYFPPRYQIMLTFDAAKKEREGMSWKKRPGMNELLGKLVQAKKALAEGKCHFGINVDKLVDDFIELNIDNAEEIWPLLNEILEEIQPKHYAGPHPPMKSVNTHLNCELFIFVWNSKKMKKEMYLKFAIKDDYFYYVSLHKSKKPDKCWKFVNNFQRPRRK